MKKTFEEKRTVSNSRCVNGSHKAHYAVDETQSSKVLATCICEIDECGKRFLPSTGSYGNLPLS